MNKAKAAVSRKSAAAKPVKGPRKSSKLLELYYWPTPNGHKVTMTLEEIGFDYRIIPVDLGKGGQFSPDFLKIAPNNRMPAIVDTAPKDGGEPIALLDRKSVV